MPLTTHPYSRVLQICDLRSAHLKLMGSRLDWEKIVR
jgi:hypothetical protein